MEPIERDLEERRERRKRLAIELQRLEAIRPAREIQDAADLEAFDEHDRKIVEVRDQLGIAEFAIRELEEIIAEKQRPPQRAPKPDTSRRRRLSDEERAAIAADARAEFTRNNSTPDDWELHIHVERFTDSDGKPQIGFFSQMKPYGPQKPSGGS